MLNSQFLNLIKTRRSQYALGKELAIPQEQVTQLIQETIKHTPSSFNSQSSRAVILYGKQSDLFWDIVKNELKKLVPADAFATTEQKINSFAAGAGTILFYEDQDVVKGLQEQFPSYADNFPIWSEHSSGIAQFAVWTALSELNIGASLQHYNPLPDEAAAAQWNIPASWKLRAQMPFGSNEAGFTEKQFMNDNDRFKVFA